MKKQTTTNFDNHEYVIRLTDASSGLQGVIAVHSTARGPAHGGTRMMSYSSYEDAVEDALNLSRAMSYKSALAGLPYGGAKGVILSPAKAFDKKKILKAYAEKIDKMGGLFRTGTDVGLTDKDTALMKEHTRYILGLPKEGNDEWSTSNAAATGVFNAIKAATKFKFGTTGLKDVTVAVKGVGKLGGHLVDLLVAAGATVTVADIEPEKTDHLKKRHPSIRAVDYQIIHAEPVSIFAPCALGGEFDEKSVSELKCQMVVGGANNQLKDENVGDLLHNRNILYVPDYVANAGGLIFVCEDLEEDGFQPKRVAERLNNISETVTEILEKSKSLNQPTHRVADKIAQERITMVQ